MLLRLPSRASTVLGAVLVGLLVGVLTLLGPDARSAASAPDPAGSAAAPAAATSAASPTATPAPVEPLRIMLLGDSVTQGRVGDITWRYRLWQQLTSQGVAFDLVGPWDGQRHLDAGGRVTFRSDGYRTRFDVDHASRWGLRLSDVPAVQNWVRRYDTDLVVVGLGVNDLLAGTTPRAAAQLLEQRVVAMRAVDPQLDVLLTPPSQTWVAGVPEYRRLMGDLARRLDRPTARVQLAPVPLGYQRDRHTWDGLHPNAEGEARIGRAVSEGLVSLGVLRPIAPAAPGVAVSTPAAGTATFTVTPDPWATGVEVYVRDRARPTVWGAVSVRGTTATFRGASARTTYDVRVITTARGVRSPATTVPFRVR